MTSAIEEYNNVLQSGQINACKKLKAVYQHLTKNIQHPGKFHFDKKAADRAVTFIETFCCIPKMRGTPRFKLELWQKALVEATFGFVNDQNIRQYREVFLFIGRKNAKSILGAAMALYLLLADGEDGPEIYTAATDRSQAKVVWEYAISMINHDASLKKYLRPKVNLIECKENGGKFVPLSKNSGSLDGLNVSGMFLDELHAIKDRNMYDVLKGGTYSRSQPLTVIMSTGGYYERDSLFDTKYSEYMSIIDGYSTGRYVDESTLPIIYELDSKEEVVDPSNWIKANPNLGVSKNPERLEREFNRATLDEKTMRDLLVKQFNFRENARDTFFNLEDVENKETFNLDDLSAMCWACRYFMMHRRAGRCPRRRGLRRCAGRPMDQPSGYCWKPFWRWSRPGAGRGPSRRGGASYAPAAPGGTGCPAGIRGGCATPFPRSALIWRRWPGRSWASSCCGRPMGCRSTMWRWPPFWSGEGQKQAGAAEAAPALLCLHGQDQK